MPGVRRRHWRPLPELTMARMFVEGRKGTYDSVRTACSMLMRELDDEAAKNGHRVVGDVTIIEVENAIAGHCLRLEADVVPAV